MDQWAPKIDDQQLRFLLFTYQQTGVATPVCWTVSVDLDCPTPVVFEKKVANCFAVVPLKQFDPIKLLGFNSLG